MESEKSRSKTLLIVDDEQDLLEILEFEFTRAGYRCLTASNGKQALERLGSAPVDAVLSDISMPEMDGLEFLAKVRCAGNEIPFVIVSAHADRGNTLRALRLGAFDFLEKPFDPKALLETVGSALELGWNRNLIEERLEGLCDQAGVQPENRERFKNALREVLLLKAGHSGHVRKVD